MSYLKMISKKAAVSAAILTTLLCSFTVKAQNNDTYIKAEYQDYIYEISENYHLCPELVMAIIEAESSGNRKAVNADCIGLMQVSKHYHSDRMAKLGVTDLYDPYSNILVGCDYLLELFEEYEDIATVLMVYNGTSNAIERGVSCNYTDYAIQIMERSYELERVHGK